MKNYDNGDTSFYMQDDASTDNGYLAINFNGLTVGQAYKLQWHVLHTLP